jgi:hypothetical protein
MTSSKSSFGPLAVGSINFSSSKKSGLIYVFILFRKLISGVKIFPEMPVKVNLFQNEPVSRLRNPGDTSIIPFFIPGSIGYNP